MQLPGRLLPGKALFDAAVSPLRGVLRVSGPLPAQRQVLVAGDAAQPHPQGALSPETVDGGQRLEKRLLGHFLRRMDIPAQGQCIAVHIRKVLAVYRLKFLHPLTSSCNRRAARRFVTIFFFSPFVLRKKTHCLSAKFII